MEKQEKEFEVLRSKIGQFEALMITIKSHGLELNITYQRNWYDGFEDGRWYAGSFEDIKTLDQLQLATEILRTCKAQKLPHPIQLVSALLKRGYVYAGQNDPVLAVHELN